jgi:hypothetical protein
VWILPFRFPDQNFVRIYDISHSCYVPSAFHEPSFHINPFRSYRDEADGRRKRPPILKCVRATCKTEGWPPMASVFKLRVRELHQNCPQYSVLHLNRKGDRLLNDLTRDIQEWDEWPPHCGLRATANYVSHLCRKCWNALICVATDFIAMLSDTPLHPPPKVGTAP